MSADKSLISLGYWEAEYGLCQIEWESAFEIGACLVGIRELQGAAVSARDKGCEVEPQSRSAGIPRA